MPVYAVTWEDVAMADWGMRDWAGKPPCLCITYGEIIGQDEMYLYLAGERGVKPDGETDHKAVTRILKVLIRKKHRID